MHRRLRGLKMEDRGGLAYHGATNFVHLPASDRNTGGNKFLPLTDVNFNRRERLVNNAWQQRALENLSDIPVRCFSCGPEQVCWLTWANPYRSRSNTC